MTIPPIERKIRSGLPLIRFMQKYIPVPVTNFLLRRSVARVELGEGVRREAVSADGVPCTWLIPENGRADHVLLYLHGGGFVYGLTPLHLKMGAYLAREMGLRLLMVDYRLAPEHPFPAALEDSVTAYGWLLKQGVSAQDMVVAGDSAGGNLTITTLMKLRDEGIPLPAAAACLSPATDFTPKENQRPGFEDPMIPPKAVKLYTQAYVGEDDPHHPLISPVFGDLHGLPPLLVHAGEDEILREDAVRIVRVAQSAGVDARLEIYPRMWHVWQLNLDLPQATRSLDDIIQFFQTHKNVQNPTPI
ncbi:MAG: Monoterpene epsilon-lactone hydrolase [Chloroflexi bacterium]|nr:Monoterpene epsilon-lactone hydrolase [Chloroflexota bacterium]